MAGPVRIAILANAAKARSEFRSVADEGERLGSRLKSGLAAGAVAAAGGLAVLGAGIGKSLVDGVKSAESYQRVLAKTAAVIKSTGNASKISVKGVKRLAGQLETLSGVDEELIVNSQNVLATFTKVRNETGKNNKVFDRATKAAVDMSAALGTDLQGATIQLGKALNDPVKGISALTRSGVSFTQQQKDQIKTLAESGRELEAQKLILAEVEKQFGGAAKAAGGEGLTGAINRMKDAWGDMWRDVATNALPVLESVTDWVTKTAIPAFGDWVGYIQTKFVPKVAALLKKIDLPDLDFKVNLGKIRRQAERIIKPFSDGIRRGIEKNDWGPFGKALGDALRKVIEGGIDLGSSIFKALKNWAADVDWLQLGKDIGKQALPFIVGFLAGFADIETLFASVKTNPGDWVVGILSVIGIGKAIGPLKSAVAKIPILKAFEPLLGAIEKITVPFAKAFDKVFKFLGTRFLEGFRKFIPEGVVSGPLRRLADDLLLRLLYLGDAVKRGFDTIAGFIPRLIGRLVGRAVSAIASTIRTVGGRVAAAASTLSGRIVGGLRDLPGRLAQLAKGAVGRLRDRLVSATSNASDWLFAAGVAIFDGLLDGLESVWENKIKPFLKWVGEQIPLEKGPPSKDAKLLVRAGKLVMGGFEVGLRSRFGSVRKSLRDFTRGLADKRDAKIVSDAFSRAFASLQRQVAKQREVVRELVRARRDYARGLSDSLRGGGLQAVQIDGEDLNPRLTLINGLQARLKAIKDFQAQLKTLRKKGLSADVIRQIADAGLEGGAQYLAALRGATPEVIAQFNRLNRAIKGASNSTGNQVAGDLFDARIRAERAELPPQKVVLELKGSDTKAGKLLIELLRESIRKANRGGGRDSVQLVLG